MVQRVVDGPGWVRNQSIHDPYQDPRQMQANCHFVNSLAMLQEIVQLKDLALQCLPLTHLALNHSDLSKGGMEEVELLASWEEDNPSPH